ncbi:acetyltransferase [Fulvivirgaceae bacterium PWU4]|uniref:Acetyltransferase n=1 Tax=Chryseosolibacter histidini TaxID=2782349 RepID=A0AAP2GLV0_9BACT|nr:acetyltransferase [Chryseosolibacter histidini]MBT1700509.1 acetyltransferase [Chryseosolibacter histidini]
MEVIIIGAGGHAAEIDEYIAFAGFDRSKTPAFKVAGFIDDNPASYARYKLSAPFLGSIREHVIQKDKQYVMGIANLAYRRPIVERFLAEGARFATVIHPVAYVSPSAKIGTGVVIAPYVNIGPNVEVGDFTLLNARVSLGHDSAVGQHNFISPNVSFSGFTKVGDDNLFGINSATIPGITVGNRNKIAAGMVLDKSVEDDTVVFYRFKEKVIATQKI